MVFDKADNLAVIYNASDSLVASAVIRQEIFPRRAAFRSLSRLQWPISGFDIRPFTFFVYEIMTEKTTSVSTAGAISGCTPRSVILRFLKVTGEERISWPPSRPFSEGYKHVFRCFSSLKFAEGSWWDSSCWRGSLFVLRYG